MFISTEKICDSIIHCQFGSDELLCEHSKIHLENCYQPNFFSINCDFSDEKMNNKSMNRELKNSLSKLHLIKMIGNVPFLNFGNLNTAKAFRLEKEQNYFIFNSKNFQNLIKLELLYNSINKNFLFDNQMILLQYLDISFNKIDKLELINHLKCSNLKILNISNTKIHNLLKKDFEFLENLEIFEGNNCFFKIIQENFIPKNNKLKIWRMINSKLPEKISKYIMIHLLHIQVIHSTSFRLCCLTFKLIGGHVKCLPSSQIFKSCSELLSRSFLKIFYWSFGVIGLIGNSLCVIFLIKKKHSLQNNELCLSICDLLISITVLSVAVIDKYFSKSYFLYDEIWRSSKICQALGVTMTFLFLFSSFCILFIMLDKFIIINLTFLKLIFKKFSMKIHIFLAIFCIFSVILPLFKNPVIL